MCASTAPTGTGVRGVAARPASTGLAISSLAPTSRKGSSSFSGSAPHTSSSGATTRGRTAVAPPQPAADVGRRGPGHLGTTSASTRCRVPTGILRTVIATSSGPEARKGTNIDTSTGPALCRRATASVQAGATARSRRGLRSLCAAKGNTPAAKISQAFIGGPRPLRSLGATCMSDAAARAESGSSSHGPASPIKALRARKG